MNDRCKFKVWNKARQCFMPEKEIFICGNGELVLIDEALNRTWVKNNPNYKVFFCTGLKDKNGKLIYEGDIVKQNKTLYIVNWENGSFCFKDALNGKNYTVEFVMSEKQEVIGNIYQDKELLNEN